MATGLAMHEAAVAVLAKAPVPGFAKTRLIPHLRAEGAARLQERLIDRALATAVAAGIGPVTLWCTPGVDDPFFRETVGRHDVRLAAQPDGDLGERMLSAFRAALAGTGLVLIGTDCPILSPADLRDAAAVLSNADLAMAPAEDGGYGLIAARLPFPELFDNMPWGTERVATLTRERAHARDLALAELRTIWDVDTASDFRRLCAAGLVDVTDLGPPPATA